MKKLLVARLKELTHMEVAKIMDSKLNFRTFRVRHEEERAKR